MPRKQRQNNDGTVSTDEIVKKVKTAFLETIVRDWLNTPVKEWKGLTPLAMIRKGEGQQILDAIKKAEEEIKNERNTKKDNKNGDGNTKESVREKAISSGD